MSESNVLETGLPPVTTPTAESGSYTQSMVTLLTRSNPETAIAEAIEHLIEKRTHWENNELASANESLYGLLQRMRSINPILVD